MGFCFGSRLRSFTGFFFFCFSVTNGSYSHMEEEEDGELYGHGMEINSSTLHSYIQDRFVVVYAFFLT